MMTFVNVTIDQWELMRPLTSGIAKCREGSPMPLTFSAAQTVAMNEVYLAFQIKSDNTPWLAVGLIAVIAGVIAWGLWMTFIGSRQTKIRGQALTGTARVLGVKTRGAVGDAVQGAQRVVCRIRLSVEVPGREPYEATARQNFRPRTLDAIHVGRTVAVQVDAGNPQRVRIDLSRPPEAGSASMQTVFNAPPVVSFNQSSWSPQTGWSGSPPSGDIADQLKTVFGNPFISAADLLATGQRVPAVLKSFAPTGTTARSLGRTASRPELIDAPHYMLEVELHFPHLAPMTGRAVQAVPVSQVPNLAIGLQLTCAVDPADPTHRFVVDWAGI
ncbi:hypothetical protein GGC64_001660 [Mycobacterium sp. OAS707]|uniref:hypothetical protein n=1 Tax=Mycobacterium sp. OAS707 TaxID=2663822 RepID=UPI00178931FB|nr:hypothetical protein [Mycobacterium sp. OAS707]MBE1547652.1 hypothetical protein [Mycobacterium sp. OAS707]